MPSGAEIPPMVILGAVVVGVSSGMIKWLGRGIGIVIAIGPSEIILPSMIEGFKSRNGQEGRDE
jgi:hypothetical protein